MDRASQRPGRGGGKRKTYLDTYLSKRAGLMLPSKYRESSNPGMRSIPAENTSSAIELRHAGLSPTNAGRKGKKRVCVSKRMCLPKIMWVLKRV